MSVRDNLPPGPGPGRRKGVPNKVSRDIKELSARLLNDPAYVEALKVRLRRGTAQAVEVQLYHYAYGKPKETVALEARTDLRRLSTAELVAKTTAILERLKTAGHTTSPVVRR